MVKCLPEFVYFYCILVKRNFISKIRRSKVTDYGALSHLVKEGVIHLINRGSWKSLFNMEIDLPIFANKLDVIVCLDKGLCYHCVNDIGGFMPVSPPM